MAAETDVNFTPLSLSPPPRPPPSPPQTSPTPPTPPDPPPHNPLTHYHVLAHLHQVTKPADSEAMVSLSIDADDEPKEAPKGVLDDGELTRIFAQLLTLLPTVH